MEEDQAFSHSAASSALGYLYQVRYALLEALRRLRKSQEFLVNIETLDDIVFDAQGQPTELLQTKHYVLAKIDQDTYKILTAYEIQGDTVSPLDGSRTESGGRQGSSIFDKHNGENLDSFMAEIDMAINNTKERSSRP